MRSKSHHCLTGLIACTLLAISLQSNAAGFEPTYDEAAVEAHVTTAIEGLINGETTEFVALLDVEALLDRVLANVDMRADTRQQFRAGIVAGEESIARNLSSALAAAESVTHLRTRSEVGQVSVLYRIDFGENGLNYHEYYYDPRTDQIFDWHDYVMGRDTSESMRGVAMSMLGPQSIAALLSTLFDDSQAHSQRLAGMAAHIRGKEYAQAVALFRAAPEPFKSLDPALTFLIMAATSANDQVDYQYALDQVARYGGDNPRYAFVLVDYYLLRGDFDKSIAAANMLQQRLGLVEAGVEELKAGIYLSAGNAPMAIEQFERSVEIEPYRDTAYASLFELYATAGRYPDAHQMLATLNQEFNYGLDAEDFAGDPQLGGYVQWARNHHNE